MQVWTSACLGNPKCMLKIAVEISVHVEKCRNWQLLLYSKLRAFDSV